MSYPEQHSLSSSDSENTPSASSSSQYGHNESSGPDREGVSSRPQPGPANLPPLNTNLDQNDDRSDDWTSRGGLSDDSDEGYDSERIFKPPARTSLRGHSRDYSPEEEREVIKKFDRRLVPFLALLYMLSFLDRSNIGNAKIAGLTDDLHLSSGKYEWLLTAFYITYIAFEWMTLMYKLVPAHIYIPLCVTSFGLVASMQCLATSFWAMAILRALLGVSEAAFGPGVPFYLSLFYRREELAFRTALFISAAPLASSFASSLAWLIVKLGSAGPIAPWRLLFLAEGFPSVVVAVFAWMFIPDSPSQARFLTRRERKVARLRLQGSKSARHETSETFNWKAVLETLRDPKSYLPALMFLGCNVAFSSMPVFLPTIVKDMGYSALASQALSAPPFLAAFVVVILTASRSDRSRTRSPYLIFHALLSSLSYLALGIVGHFHDYIPSKLNTFLRYLCIFPATAGFFSAVTIIIVWSMDNRVAHEGKGTGVAILNVIGQCGPLIGTRLYPDADGPWYVRGMMICFLFMIFVAALAITLRLLLARANRKLAEAERQVGIEMDTRAAENEGLMGGRESNRFTYII